MLHFQQTSLQRGEPSCPEPKEPATPVPDRPEQAVGIVSTVTPQTSTLRKSQELGGNLESVKS